jgi:hypothetical protein
MSHCNLVLFSFFSSIATKLQISVFRFLLPFLEGRGGEASVKWERGEEERKGRRRMGEGDKERGREEGEGNKGKGRGDGEWKTESGGQKRRGGKREGDKGRWRRRKRRE